VGGAFYMETAAPPRNILPPETNIVWTGKRKKGNGVYERGENMGLQIKMILAILLSLIIAGQAFGQDTDSAALSSTGEYGYVSVDKNLVAIPGGLQAGDQVAVYNTNGEEIALSCVMNETSFLTISDIPDGVYTIMVCREDKIIDTQQVPIIGTEGR
jgi:hypothetical protein